MQYYLGSLERTLQHQPQGFAAVPGAPHCCNFIDRHIRHISFAAMNINCMQRSKHAPFCKTRRLTWDLYLHNTSEGQFDEMVARRQNNRNHRGSKVSAVWKALLASDFRPMDASATPRRHHPAREGRQDAPPFYFVRLTHHRHIHD